MSFEDLSPQRLTLMAREKISEASRLIAQAEGQHIENERDLRDQLDAERNWKPYYDTELEPLMRAFKRLGAPDYPDTELHHQIEWLIERLDKAEAESVELRTMARQALEMLPDDIDGAKAKLCDMTEQDGPGLYEQLKAWHAKHASAWDQVEDVEAELTRMRGNDPNKEES